MALFEFDIDGVISILEPHAPYETAKPNQKIIDIINALYDEGNTIIINTARGKASQTELCEFTKEQIDSWGVKYHELLFTKPGVDYYIDDKSLTPEKFQEIFEGKTKEINTFPKTHVEKEEERVCL